MLQTIAAMQSAMVDIGTTPRSNRNEERLSRVKGDHAKEVSSLGSGRFLSPRMIN